MPFTAPEKGCIVMCLRNMSPTAGCYNGTTTIANDVQNSKILRCTIINGCSAGAEISIPRIKLRPQDLTNQPCEWEILQFPVRLSYAMTIDKIQGQTLTKLGVLLGTKVFGHDQLYVAASITDAYSSVIFAVLPYKPDDPYITVNLVYGHIPIGLHYFLFY
jgi:ATP-dependent DNA helicase PIF1